MEVKIINAHETYPLRSRVLRPGLPRSECLFEGDEHELSQHFGLFQGEHLQAVVSLIWEPKVISGRSIELRLRGMATHPDLQGQGLGAHLLQTLGQRHPTPLWCYARIRARSFYQRQGFRPHGEIFELPGVGPHLCLYRSPE